MKVTVKMADVFAVEVTVEHNKGRPIDKNLAVVDPSTIVVAELVPESEYAAKLLA